MQETKIKIWDFDKNSFVADPTDYIKFQYIQSIDSALHIFPVLKPGVNAEMLYFSGYQDQHAVDIYEGDRLAFLDVKEQKTHICVLTKNPILFIWNLGGFLFEDVYYLKIVGNKFDLGPGQNPSNFLY